MLRAGAPRRPAALCQRSGASPSPEDGRVVEAWDSSVDGTPEVGAAPSTALQQACYAGDAEPLWRCDLACPDGSRGAVVTGTVLDPAGRVPVYNARSTCHGFVERCFRSLTG
ncbi:MAG TPA: hypothetical protein VKU41_32565 [Polyangiaceae bacterium]|nr:hypothetical protein [Polyangiaceae bacterium]